ncbi:MAG: glycosyltransferase family 4 protein [Thermodesulfobacteriota bacterium]
MRILFLTNAYPDFKDSYRGIFIKKIASLLQKEGYEISVVTPRIYEGSRYFEEEDGIKVYRFPFFARNKLLVEYKKIPFLRMILYYVTGFFLTVYTVLRDKCDVIHVHWAIPTGLIGVWIKALLRKPFIVTIHGSDLRMALDRPGFLRKIFVYVCKKADHLNCVSEVQKKELERLGVPTKKISTIPMGIDASFLETGKNREVESWNRPITILSNRNLLPIYNVSLLIRAIPIVLKEEPGTKFLIAGEGSEKVVLEKEVKNLNINSSVKFLGRVPHDQMPNLLSQADIYVSTSLYDGTSVSLLEAMGSGAFPVVTDIPANREWIINGENGFLISPHEPKSLASRIIDAIRNHELLQKGPTKNRLIVEQRALWSEYIKRIRSIYTNILNS